MSKLNLAFYVIISSLFFIISLKFSGAEAYHKNRCSLAIHELGHLLGLSDTYPNPDCPDQETEVMPLDDIMHSSGFFQPSQARFYPAAIRSILQPLCGR